MFTPKIIFDGGRICLLAFLFNLTQPASAYATESGCTAKIKAGTDRMIWGGEPLPYSTEIIFGAQKTDRVMDGPELVTTRGTGIPRIFLYDISPECKSLREWNYDPYYYQKWYGR